MEEKFLSLKNFAPFFNIFKKCILCDVRFIVFYNVIFKKNIEEILVFEKNFNFIYYIPSINSDKNILIIGLEQDICFCDYFSFEKIIYKYENIIDFLTQNLDKFYYDSVNKHEFFWTDQNLVAYYLDFVSYGFSEMLPEKWKYLKKKKFYKKFDYNYNYYYNVDLFIDEKTKLKNIFFKNKNN